MRDGVKGHTQVKVDEDGQNTRVRREKKTIGNLYESSLSAVEG